MVARRLIALLLAALAWAPLAFAQVEGWQAAEFFDLSCGLNESDPTTLKPCEASDLQNVVFTTSGAITKRPFFAPLHNNVAATCGGGPATALGFYKQSDGDRFLVSLCSDDTIKKMDYGSGTSGPDGTWDDITGALSFNTNANILGDFATVHDTAIIEDGLPGTPPYQWNGSGNAAALAGSPPNATMVEFHKRHLFLAGRTGATSEVAFSALDNINSYSTLTDFVLVETDDGQAVTGLKSGLDCLYIFKTESIWRLCGTNKDDFTLEQMVEGIGASNNQAITTINNQFVFQTARGDIAIYDGGLAVQVISGKIETTLSGLEFNRTQLAVSTAFDDGTGDQDFYLCVTTVGATEHDTVLVFDTLHKAWTKFAGMNCNAMTPYEIGTVQTALAFSDYDGVVNRYPTTHANAEMSNEAYYRSGHLSFSVPQQKTYHHAQIITRQEDGDDELSFQPRVDFSSESTATALELGGTGAVWDTAVFDTDEYSDLTTTIHNVGIQKTGNFFQWYVESLEDQDTFLLRGVRIWHEPTGRVE